jgi:hypothetical protein
MVTLRCAGKQFAGLMPRGVTLDPSTDKLSSTDP